MPARLDRRWGDNRPGMPRSEAIGWCGFLRLILLVSMISVPRALGFARYKLRLEGRSVLHGQSLLRGGAIPLRRHGLELWRHALPEADVDSSRLEAQVDKAYELWASQFPEAAKDGKFFRRSASRADIGIRLQRLRVALGATAPLSMDSALRLVEVEGAVLFAPTPKRTFDQLACELTGRAMGQGRATTLAALRDSPGLLLVPPRELMNKGIDVLGEARVELLQTSVAERLQQAQVDQDEPMSWGQGQGTNSRNLVMEMGKVLKPIGGAKAVYPIAFAIFYSLALFSESLRPSVSFPS